MKEMWNQRYAAKDFSYGTEPNRFFKEWIDKYPAGEILFPAEGEGRNAVYAAKKGWEVTAFDFSEEGKRKALQLADIEKVKIDYKVISAEEFTTDKRFDAIVLIFAHFPLNIRSKVHKKLIKLLKPGGVFLLEGFNKAQLKNDTGGPKNKKMLFDKNMLKDDFKDLEITLLKDDVINLDEGKVHKGRADVINFIGATVG